MLLPNQSQSFNNSCSHEKNQPPPIINKNFATLNTLMTFISSHFDSKGKYYVASTDNISQTLIKCAWPKCGGYYVAQHTKIPFPSFKVSKYHFNHKHQGTNETDIERVLNSHQNLSQKISLCQYILNKNGIGTYFYDFLQPYKAIKNEYDSQQNQNKDQFIPYILPSISKQRNIPVIYQIFNARFDHIKRLQLSILAISIMETNFSKLQTLHYLANSKQQSQLVIVMMTLIYSFFSKVKQPIIKLEEKLYKKVTHIQFLRKNHKKIQESCQKCIDQLLTLYQNYLNENNQLVKFEPLNTQELKKLQNQFLVSQQGYKTFCNKQPGIKVNQIRKWNVIKNEIQKNKIIKNIMEFYKGQTKSNDSNFIEIQSQQDFKVCHNDKKSFIQKKQTCIIEDLLVEAQKSILKNEDIEYFRQIIKKEQKQGKRQIYNEQFQDMIDLI